jgi:hypothetical protein
MCIGGVEKYHPRRPKKDVNEQRIDGTGSLTLG